MFLGINNKVFEQRLFCQQVCTIPGTNLCTEPSRFDSFVLSKHIPRPRLTVCEKLSLIINGYKTGYVTDIMMICNTTFLGCLVLQQDDQVVDVGQAELGGEEGGRGDAHPLKPHSQRLWSLHLQVTLLQGLFRRFGLCYSWPTMDNDYGRFTRFDLMRIRRKQKKKKNSTKNGVRASFL